LKLNIDAHAASTYTVKIFEPEKLVPLAPAIERLAGCVFDSPKTARLRATGSFGRCAGAFRKRGLLVAGPTQFRTPDGNSQASQGGRLEVIVRHPRSGFPAISGHCWTTETTAQSIDISRL